MAEKFRCELISWGRIRSLTQRLAGSIRAAGYRPDTVVAIARGGYVPARLLCDFLDIGDLRSIRVIHYTAGAHRHKRARLVNPLCTPVRGKRVLIVDDVSDSGDTLEIALRHIRSFRPRDVRVAVLHHKTTSPIEPDFHAQRVVKWRWITYPWAVVEDISGFIMRMKPRPATTRQAARRLEKDFGLKLPTRVIDDAFELLD